MAINEHNKINKEIARVFRNFYSFAIK